jgi:hypothetical protein
MIDASIPFRAGTAGQFSLADLAQQSQQLRHGEQAMQQRERSLDQQDRSFELQMQEHTANLDKAQREAAAAGLKDMGGAVRWATTPQQWAVVQQHLAQHSPELASVPFERREEVLLQLGQMSDYLEANQEKFQAIEPGGSLFGISPTGDVREVVRANPGSAAPMAPVGGGETRKTVGGKSYVNRNGQWFEETAASNGSGGFPGQ